MTQTTVDVRPKLEVDWQDVEYRPGLLARVYRPRGTGPFPALIEIHGGAWNAGDRTQNAELARALAANGTVVASVDFRLGGQAPYPASIADMNFATRWLKSRASEFGATPEALGGLGLSSGGHMLMLSAMRPRDPRYTALPLDAAPDIDAHLAYVMMGWPVLDPHARYLHARERGRTDLVESHHRYFGDEETMREANPQQILERGEIVELPPALIFQGADDEVLSPRTAERFAEAYGSAGGIIELAKFPRAGHGYARQGGPNAMRTVDLLNCFIERQLKAIATGWSHESTRI
jgi:acetyl esterase/lipase